VTVSQLGYVGFGVSDLDAWSSLLTEVLGFQLSARTADSASFRMDRHFHRVILTRSNSDDVEYLGWQARSFAELEAVTSRLESHGLVVQPASAAEITDRAVERMVHVEGADGLRNEIFVGPHVRSDPFIPGRPVTGFNAGSLGAGHVVLRTPDKEKAEQFYVEALGLRISDHGSGPLTFMRCNARHHSVALLPSQAAPGDKRLVHMMIEMQSLDDVGTALDLCLDRGVEIPQGLGKHSNDYSTSFYLTTPSGFEFEYAYGGRLVEEGSWEVARYLGGSVWGHRAYPYAARPAAQSSGTGK